MSDALSLHPDPSDAPAGVATALAGILCRRCGDRIDLQAKRPMRRALDLDCCDWDGCQKLAGRQERFASNRCRCAWNEHEHPRLGTVPVIPSGRSIDRMVALCADGRWRTIPEIAHDTATREATVARRIQETQTGRKGRAIPRFVWDSRVRAHSLAKEYRLVMRPEVADDRGIPVRQAGE